MIKVRGRLWSRKRANTEARTSLIFYIIHSFILTRITRLLWRPTSGRSESLSRKPAQLKWSEYLTVASYSYHGALVITHMFTCSIVTTTSDNCVAFSRRHRWIITLSHMKQDIGTTCCTIDWDDMRGHFHHKWSLPPKQHLLLWTEFWYNECGEIFHGFSIDTCKKRLMFFRTCMCNMHEQKNKVCELVVREVS